MSNKKSIKFNVIWNGILSLSSILFPLITFPYVTRTLGVETNGAISFASSTVNYFALFATLGLSTYGVKACAAVKDNKIELTRVVHELLFISGVAAIVVLACLYLSILIVPKFRDYAPYLFVYSFNIIFNVIGINYMYQGIEQYRYVTTRSIIFKIISIGMMFLMVKDPSDGVTYAAIVVFASVGGNIFNVWHSRDYIEWRNIGNYHFKRHIKPLLVLFATNLAVNVYSNLDTVMLGFIQGDYATGIYYVAVKIKSILLTLVSSFSVVILSRVSNTYSKEGEGSLFSVLKKSYSFLIFMTVPVVAFFFLNASESILFLSGEDYLSASLPMKILLPTIFISSVSQILGSQYAVAVGEENKMMYAVITGAVVNVIMNSILIPRYSYNGAAIGTLVAELTQCVIQMTLSRNVVKEVFRLSKFLLSLIATSVAIFCTFIFKMLCNITGAFAILLISAIIFFGIYCVIMYFFKYDLYYDICKTLIRKILRKENSKL